MARFSVVYAVMAGFSGSLFIWLSRVANECGESSLSILQWSSLFIVVAHLFFLGKWFYRSFNFRQKSADRMTLFIAVVSTILFAVAAHNMLYLFGWQNESSAALSTSSEYWGLCADGAWYASASESSAYDQFGCFWCCPSEAGHCRFVVVANSREDHCLYYVGSNPAGIIFPVSETEEGVVYG